MIIFRQVDKTAHEKIGYQSPEMNDVGDEVVYDTKLVMKMFLK